MNEARPKVAERRKPLALIADLPWDQNTLIFRSHRERAGMSEPHPGARVSAMGAHSARIASRRRSPCPLVIRSWNREWRWS